MAISAYTVSDATTLRSSFGLASNAAKPWAANTKSAASGGLESEVMTLSFLILIPFMLVGPESPGDLEEKEVLGLGLLEHT